MRLSKRGSITQGTVTAVDKDSNTCTVQIGVNEVVNVPLKPTTEETNFVIYPAVGSSCAVFFYEKNPLAPVLFMVQTIDSIAITNATDISITADSVTFNGGDNGGLINIEALTGALNDLVSTFNQHTHTSAASGSPTSTTLSPAQTFNQSDYEDTTITH